MNKLTTIEAGEQELNGRARGSLESVIRIGGNSWIFNTKQMCPIKWVT